MEDDSLSPDAERAIEELRAMFEKLPKERITMLNMPRYAQAFESIKKIVAYIKDDCPDATIKVDFDGLLGTNLILEIITNELNVYKISDFCQMIEPADTISIIPRLDEKIMIGIEYKNVREFVPPQTDNAN